MSDSTQIAPDAGVEPDASNVVTEPKSPEPNTANLSREDAINKALDDMGASDDDAPKAEEKAEPEAKEPAPVKDEEKAEEKPEEEKKEPEAKEPEEPKEPKPEKADKGPHPEAPKNFLPAAKEVWRNVPHAVKNEVERLVREHEAEIEKVRESNDRYENVRDFDELARSNGRDLRESLIRVHQIETQLQQNPVAGLNAILMEAGPRKADGQPLSLFELATAIVNAGQNGYMQAVQQAPQQQQAQTQVNPEVQQLRQQVARMEQQQLENSVIAPFKAANPRYDELKGDIAFFLQSDKVPASLSASDRLAAAYDMAVRINPPSHVHTDASMDSPAPEPRRADPDFGGSRSIKGSPSSGVNPSKPNRKVSKDDAINLAMAEIFGSQG